MSRPLPRRARTASGPVGRPVWVERSEHLAQAWALGGGAPAPTTASPPRTDMVSSTGLAQPSASRATASVSSPAGMVSYSSRPPMPRRLSRI